MGMAYKLKKAVDISDVDVGVEMRTNVLVQLISRVRAVRPPSGSRHMVVGAQDKDQACFAG